MVKILLSLIMTVALASLNNTKSDQVLKSMYERYHGKWYHNFTFVQTTERFKNDSLVNSSIWYEAISYPDKFRIDFGDLRNGDAVIFANDSAYNFGAGTLKSVKADKNDLTFLLGGMYFYTFEQVLGQVRDLHYDLEKFHEDAWKGRPVYVIGADKRNEKSNQLWIDKENLIVVRFIKYDENRKEEGILANHQQFGGGWSETEAVFYINDKLIQKEYYRECRANVEIDPAVFQPQSFGKVHWYKGK